MKILKECIYSDDIAGNHLYCIKLENKDIKRRE